MASNSNFCWQTVDERLLRNIYDSDQAMYPAPQLTYDRLKSWVDACPELCLCLRRGHSGPKAHLDTSEDETIHGIILVLPLRQPYWDRLRHAQIDEHDVDAIEMFPPPSTGSHAYGEGDRTKIGLHVFHIERFPGFATTRNDVGFTALALEEVRNRVTDTFKSWEVVGYSALTATKQGNAAFKRLEFALSESASGSSLLHRDAEMVERRGNETFLSRLSGVGGDEADGKVAISGPA